MIHRFSSWELDDNLEKISTGRERTMRKNIILECTITKERIYLTTKNTRNTPERLELKKYSPKLRKKVVFKEVK